MDDARLRELLGPYLDAPLTGDQYLQIEAYVALILKWNARTNLTAVREPEALVQRQVGESLFAARFLGDAATLLDFGSGAGFPGIPLTIARPEIAVTLAESQGKKAGFLREAVRTLGLAAVVWARRVEEMPAGRVFDVVAMRAVDDSERMLEIAGRRVHEGGRLIRYVGENVPVEISGWEQEMLGVVPNSKGMLQILRPS